jgi:hypothetical protein
VHWPVSRATIAEGTCNPNGADRVESISVLHLRMHNNYTGEQTDARACERERERARERESERARERERMCA